MNKVIITSLCMVATLAASTALSQERTVKTQGTGIDVESRVDTLRTRIENIYSSFAPIFETVSDTTVAQEEEIKRLKEELESLKTLKDWAQDTSPTSPSNGNGGMVIYPDLNGLAFNCSTKVVNGRRSIGYVRFTGGGIPHVKLRLYEGGTVLYSSDYQVGTSLSASYNINPAVDGYDRGYLEATITNEAGNQMKVALKHYAISLTYDAATGNVADQKIFTCDKSKTR